MKIVGQNIKYNTKVFVSNNGKTWKLLKNSIKSPRVKPSFISYKDSLFIYGGLVGYGGDQIERVQGTANFPYVLPFTNTLAIDNS